MTEELISTMSKIGNLSVISRTSVMKYKKESKSVTEIARELSVGTILEGSVRLAGNKIRVTIQMIDPAMDKHLWAESFDRELQDVFEVQSDIAHRIASTLSVQLLSTEKDDIERPPTENTEVYQLYLKGRYHVNKGWAENRKDSERARRYFEEALKLDPGFALAHAGISDYYHAAAHANWYAPEEAYPLMRDHAMKAIDLDPRLAEGHAALAAEYMHYEWMWEEAEKEFKKAIALKPSYDNAYAIYSYLLAVTGRFDGEYEMLKRADELDPFGAVRRLLVPALMHVGKGEEAMEIAKSVVEELPESLNAHEALGWMLHRASREDEALLEFRKAVSLSNEDSAARADLAFILALTGRKEEAGAILEQLRELSRTTYISDVKLACILYVLGKHDDAFKSLEIAYGRRAIDLPELRLMPELRELCEDSRWISIENRMGLPHLGPLPEGRQDIHPGPPAGEVGPQRQDPQ